MRMYKLIYLFYKISIVFIYLSILQFYCSLVLIRKVEENISLFLFFTSWASIDLVPSKEFLFLKSSISKNNHKSIFPDQIKSPSVFSTAIKAAIRCCLVERGESIDHPEDNVRRIFSWFQHFLCRQSLILNIIWEELKD